MNFFNKVVYASFSVLFLSFASLTHANPNLYAIDQQDGEACPYMPWINLEKIRTIRIRGDGHIAFQDSDFSPKIHTVAECQPRLVALDKMFDKLRSSGGAYGEYEALLRREGITNTQRYTEDGTHIKAIEQEEPLQEIRASRSPYNICKDDSYIMRWLPIITKDIFHHIPNGKSYFEYQYHFYDYTTKTTSIIPLAKEAPEADIPQIDMVGFAEHLLPTQRMLEVMNLDPIDLERVSSLMLQGTQKRFGSRRPFFISSSWEPTVNTDYLYDMGTLQNMLLACGVNSNNEAFADGDDSLEARASRELQTAVRDSDLNPWNNIDKNDLFEYHLANIFKENSELKELAQTTVGALVPSWNLYKEGLELYDAPREPRTKLSEKTRFLPGEDQMLAYYVSEHIHILATACINTAAIFETEETEPVDGITSEYLLEQASSASSSGSSFLDVWDRIVDIFRRTIIEPTGKVDFVRFSSHGSVMSFDPELVEMQEHEHKAAARRIGFAIWDSAYGKTFQPFYRRPGTAADVLGFEEE